MVIRSDYTGFGFILKKREPPHQVTNIGANSPAEISGLQNDDLILTVNDKSVEDEKYEKVVLLIKNGINAGLIKFEVIQPNYYKKEPVMSSSLKSSDAKKFLDGQNIQSGFNKSTLSLPGYSSTNDTTIDNDNNESSLSNTQIPKKALSLNNLDTNTLQTLNTSTKSNFLIIHNSLFRFQSLFQVLNY